MQIVTRIIFFFLIILIKLTDVIIRGILQTVSRLKAVVKSVITAYTKLARTSLQFLSRLHLPKLQVSPISKKSLVYSRQRAKKVRGKSLTLSPISFWLKLRYATVGAAFASFFVFLPLLALIFLQDLPHPEELSLKQIAQTTKIYDRHGSLLYEVYTSQNRTLVPLSAVPVHLQQATLAIEDKNFYKHPGFDIASIIRAARENFTGQSIQGGSTITQQLIKSSMLTTEQSITRKVKEIVLAFWAERMYTKPQILEMYFNQVPYGGTAWGTEAASEVYFGKAVKDLTLAESAFLAGITQAPTTYSPYGADASLWKKRQKEVLSRMAALGFISEKQKNEAEKEQLIFKEPRVSLRAPHFVAYIREELVKKYGLAMVEKGGLQVTTSLDLAMQDMAQKIVREEVDNAAYLHLSNGAALITNPANGDILAMVGSRDYGSKQWGKVNLTTSRRQPGSTIKVVTYSAALANGLTAASIIDDAPVSYTIPGAAPYKPVNYDGRYFGRLPLRLALGNSLNIPAVKVLHRIGIPTMVNMGKAMGITSWGDPTEYGLSITLGAAEVTMLDMATVNGTLANGGMRVDLNPILKITDYKGKVLEEKTTPEGTRVFDAGIAFIISHILADNTARTLAFGPNSILQIPGHTVSVKTGTTDNKRDNWTVGYTNNFVVAAWVGNNDNTPMSQTLASGITGAAPIWHKIMANLLEKTPENPLRQPDDIVRQPCFGRMEYFIKGSETSATCNRAYRFPVRQTTPRL